MHLVDRNNTTRCADESSSTFSLLPDTATQFQGCTEAGGVRNKSKVAQPQVDGRPITKGVIRVDITKGAPKEETPKVVPATLPQSIATSTRAHADRANPPTSAPVSLITQSLTLSQLAAAAIYLANKHTAFPVLD